MDKHNTQGDKCEKSQIRRKCLTRETQANIEGVICNGQREAFTQKHLIFLYKSVLSIAHKCCRGVPLKWRDGKRTHWWYVRLAKCAHIFTSNHPNVNQFLSSSIRLIEKIANKSYCHKQYRLDIPFLQAKRRCLQKIRCFNIHGQNNHCFSVQTCLRDHFLGKKKSFLVFLFYNW